ncbi:MAG: ABC transporter ATP-binding protein [Propionibacteriales bacterium]|nr:ABC transporter ATP-binding protein [Propionibacteriales bacterium]
MTKPEPILEAVDVKVHIPAAGGRTIRALDGVSLALHPGEIVALVGESGSGKTTMARVFSLIYKATSGEVRYQGQPLQRVSRRRERAYYNDVQLIFQDPFASLNALKKISYILGRAIRIHQVAAGARAVRATVLDLLERVHLTPAESYIDRYPTDMSGGQRQRIAIARSLSMEPRVILADEPTSMLDASIRLSVLNLLDDLRRERGIAVLYITHDIASARYLSDRINVMYGGVIVESGPTEQVVSDPRHPYTELLLSAAPDPARYKGSGRSVQLDITNANPVDNTVEHRGCRFVDRCPKAMEKCADASPELITFGDRQAACWLVGQDTLVTGRSQQPKSSQPSRGSGDPHPSKETSA